MLKREDFFAKLYESKQQSRNQVVTLTKDEEFNLSKQSKLPVTMRVGAFKVQASIHAQARSVQRRGDKSAEEWKDYARKMVKYIEDNKIKSGTYMFHSQSQNQSVVGTVKGRELNLVTVFPKGTGGRISAKQTAAGQKSAMMESLIEALMVSDGFDSMLNEAKELIGNDVDGILVFDLDEEMTIMESMAKNVEFNDVPAHQRETKSKKQFGHMVLSNDKTFAMMVPDSHDVSYFGKKVARVDLTGGGRFDKAGAKTFVVMLDLNKGTVSFLDQDSDDDKTFEKPEKFKKFIVFDKDAASRY